MGTRIMMLSKKIFKSWRINFCSLAVSNVDCMLINSVSIKTEKIRWFRWYQICRSHSLPLPTWQERVRLLKKEHKTSKLYSTNDIAPCCREFQRHLQQVCWGLCWLSSAEILILADFVTDSMLFLILQWAPRLMHKL